MRNIDLGRERVNIIIMNPLDVKLDKHTTCATGFFFLTVSKRMEICKEVLLKIRLFSASRLR